MELVLCVCNCRNFRGDVTPWSHWLKEKWWRLKRRRKQKERSEGRLQGDPQGTGPSSSSPLCTHLTSLVKGQKYFLLMHTFSRKCCYILSCPLCEIKDWKSSFCGKLVLIGATNLLTTNVRSRNVKISEMFCSSPLFCLDRKIQTSSGSYAMISQTVYLCRESSLSFWEFV